jgi:pyruvate, orthophosphate dikinase
MVQVRAIIKAAGKMQAAGIKVEPAVMIPLVSCPKELANQAAIVHATAKEAMKAVGAVVNYQVGTMVETPRAVLLAGELAKDAEFFSFGTNDLTQMTYGLSRDDIGRFLPMYLEDKIFEHDPFQVRPCTLNLSAYCPLTRETFVDLQSRPRKDKSIDT